MLSSQLTTYDRNSNQQFKNIIPRSGTLPRRLAPVRYALVMRRSHSSFDFVILIALFLLSCTGPSHRGRLADGQNTATDLSLALREDTLKSWGNGAPRMLVRIPNDFVLTVTNGPDFDVFRFAANDSLSKWHNSTVGIYVGHAPSSFAPNEAITLQKESRFVWKSWQEQTNGKTRFKCESVVDDLFKNVPSRMDRGGVRMLKVHMFVGADDEVTAQSLVRIAESFESVLGSEN